MEARLLVAKVFSVNPDSADIQDGLVVFGHRATGKEILRSGGVLFVRSKYSKAVVRRRWNRRTVFADKQFDVETGGWFRPVLTLLCIVRRRQDFHDEYSILLLKKTRAEFIRELGIT